MGGLRLVLLMVVVSLLDPADAMVGAEIRKGGISSRMMINRPPLNEIDSKRQKERPDMGFDRWSADSHGSDNYGENYGDNNGEIYDNYGDNYSGDYYGNDNHGDNYSGDYYGNDNHGDHNGENYGDNYGDDYGDDYGDNYSGDYYGNDNHGDHNGENYDYGYFNDSGGPYSYDYDMADMDLADVVAEVQNKTLAAWLESLDLGDLVGELKPLASSLAALPDAVNRANHDATFEQVRLIVQTLLNATLVAGLRQHDFSQQTMLQFMSLFYDQTLLMVAMQSEEEYDPEYDYYDDGFHGFMGHGSSNGSSSGGYNGTGYDDGMYGDLGNAREYADGYYYYGGMGSGGGGYDYGNYEVNKDDYKGHHGGDNEGDEDNYEDYDDYDYEGYD